MTEEGQSLIEFALITPLITLVLVGSFWVGSETFRRTECSRIVFEAVHRSAHGGKPISAVSLESSVDGVKGRMKCGTHTENLFLPRLGKRNAGASRSRF